MRITEKERISILGVAKTVFGDSVEVYLFGSRADDTKRGGDIDLYIKSCSVIENKLSKKIKFIVELEKKIGEQKIDLVLSSDNDRLIEKKAVTEGIKL